MVYKKNHWGEIPVALRLTDEQVNFLRSPPSKYIEKVSGLTPGEDATTIF